MLQHVSSRVAGFLVPSQCLWAKLANISFLKVSKEVVMPFCVADVPLPDIFTCLQTRRKSFCAAGAILLGRFQKMRCIFRGRRKTLGTGLRQVVTLQVVTLNTPQSTLQILHLILYPLHSTLYTLHSTLYNPHLILYTPHSTLYTVHYTLHFTLSILHFTLYTPHLTLYTLHSTLYTLHSILYTPHFTLHTFYSTLYTPHFTLNT